MISVAKVPQLYQQMFTIMISRSRSCLHSSNSRKLSSSVSLLPSSSLSLSSSWNISSSSIQQRRIIPNDTACGNGFRYCSTTTLPNTTPTCSLRCTVGGAGMMGCRNCRNSRLPIEHTVWKRYYSPMTKEEEEQEKERVSKLTPFKREQEEKQLNREIAKLEMLRGINTGELYTWRGQYKILFSRYGLPMMAWYFTCWTLTGLGVYVGMEVLGMDPMTIINYVDSYTGFDMANKVDPTLGKIGVVLVTNEVLEPIRLPFVIVTVKPVMDKLFPPNV